MSDRLRARIQGLGFRAWGLGDSLVFGIQVRFRVRRFGDIPGFRDRLLEGLETPIGSTLNPKPGLCGSEFKCMRLLVVSESECSSWLLLLQLYRICGV